MAEQGLLGSCMRENNQGDHMEQVSNEVEVFESDEEITQKVVFEVIENELLVVTRPTVQVYGH